MTMKRLCAVVGVLWILAAIASCAPAERITLERKNLETPKFGPPPPQQEIGATLNELASHLASPADDNILSRLVPAQAGVLWIALLVMLTVGLERPPYSFGRNLELLDRKSVV